MPNLSSNLTIKLTDDLSGPAAKAAQALRKFGVSAVDVEKAAKLSTFRQVQESFRAAATTFQTTQTNLRKLANEFAAAESPTKRMSDALKRAHDQAVAARAAFNTQTEAWRAARSGLQGLGISLNQVASEEARLQATVQRATAAMEQQAQRAQSVGARVRRGLGEALGIMSPFMGYGMLRATKAGVTAGAHLQSAKIGLTIAGVPASDLVRASGIAGNLTTKYTNLSRVDILERYKEMRSVLLHPEEAITMLPVIARANAVLKGMEGSGKIAEGSTKGLGFAVKGAEVLGLAQDPKRFENYINAFLKAKQVNGDLITPEQIYDFATNVKSSGATLSDRFIHTTAMSLTGELRGMRAGTGVDAFVKQITGGFQGQQHPAAKEFLKMGLLGKDDFEKTKSGAILGLRSGHHVAGWRLAMSDPDKWIAQYLLPAMKQHGVTDEQEQLALIRKMFTTSRGSDIVSKTVTQMLSYINHAERYREAHGLDAWEDQQNDATVALESFKTQFSEFTSVLTSPVMESAAHAMSWVARKVAETAVQFDMLAKKHPDWAKGLAGGAIAGGLAAGGGLAYYGFLRPLIRGFGLKSSALALDGSAAALTRAAVALGGESVLNGAPGAGKAPGKIIRTIKPALTGALAFGGPTAGAAALGLLGYEGYKNYPTLTPEGERKRITEAGRAEYQRRRGMSSSAFLNQEGAALRNRTDSDFTLGAKSRFNQTGGEFRFREVEVRQADARTAGETVASAFREGLITGLNAAKADTFKAVGELVDILGFRVSPSLVPSVPVSGGSAGMSSGVTGLHSDYGVAP